MKSSGVVYHVLVMSSDLSDGANVVEAWRQAEHANLQPRCELVHFNFSASTEPLVVLDVMDRIRGNFFEAVLLIPPAATWSRARHSLDKEQPPLRSRSQPLGLQTLDSNSRERVIQSNRTVEICCWAAEQALACTISQVAFLLVFPEDLGGHATYGPTSVWALKEVRHVDRFHEAQRHAVFLCRFAGADQRRPLGVLTNIKVFDDSSYLGWPRLRLKGDDLCYRGPLPKSCPCSSPHQPMTSAASGRTCNSSISPSLGVSFWTCSP